MSRLLTTISAADAARDGWDVVVVGAGPAGAVAARECARLGSKTLLIDRNMPPRDKVCGGCLGQRGAELLGRIGLKGVLDECGMMRYDRIRLSSGRRRVELRVPEGRVVRRGGFDRSLVCAAINCGVAFLPETAALDTAPSGDGNWREVHVRSHREHHAIRARCVIAADGLGGRFASAAMGQEDRIKPRSRIGFGTVVHWNRDFEEGIIHMALGDGGYLGVVRVSPTALIVAGAVRSTAVKAGGGAGAFTSSLLANAGFARIGGLTQAHWKGTRELTRRRSRVAAHRLLAIGDTSGYAEPITGEGMTWAIASGIGVAPIACASGAAWEKVLEKRWAETYRRQIRSRQHGSGVLHRILNDERVSDVTLRALAISPRLASSFTSRFAKPYPVPTRV